MVSEDQQPVYRRICPKCASRNTGNAAGKFARAASVVKNRVCRDCGTVWSPRWTKAEALTCIWLGALVFGLTAFDVYYQITKIREPVSAWAWTGLSVGASALFMGISALKGWIGKFAILGNVKDASPSILHNPAPSAGPPSAEKKCPWCGKRYGAEVQICPRDNNELIPVR